MKFLKAALMGLALCFSSVIAMADAVGPDELVKNTANEVLEILKKDKDVQAGNLEKILALTEQKIVPHFDFERISRSVIGKNWRHASKEQQERFTAEFRSFLVRIYSSALSKYRNQVIEYKPTRYQPSDTEVTVKTLILQPGGPSVPVDYKLEKIGDEWKVTDFAVEGVRIVNNYKGQFEPVFKESGMDGVIQKLAEKNKQSVTSSNDKKPG